MTPPTARRLRTTLGTMALVAATAPGCATGSSATPPASAPLASQGANPLPADPPAADPASTPANVDGERATAAPSADGAASGTPAAVASTQAPTPPRTAPPRASSEEDNPPVGVAPQSVAVTPRFPDPTSPDPLHGHYTLAQATAGLPPGNDLVADIETSMGTFACTLLESAAPATVANFVGLARGLRDFWDPTGGRWTRRPFFDGSVFHRVIPGFMVQGGDILRSGRGGPGYTIRDENVTDHDAAGLLCMANRGPNTGGAQFFITEVGLARLNGSYSVFGRCTPTALVERIARVPRSPRDQPVTPVSILHVTVHR